MRTRQLGATGAAVSEFGLGTMTWGRDTDEYEAAKQLELFLGAGGNLIDTASSFGDGAGQEILAQLLTAFSRDDVFISAKSGGTRRESRPFDNSRRNLNRCLDTSLSRLGVETVDIWMIHGFDPSTPVSETLDTLAASVTGGKASYVGVCNWPDAWVAHAHAYLQTVHRLPLACAQTEYSLVNRSGERGLLPYLGAAACSAIAWSPLGRGVLTGKYRFGTPADSRGASAHLRSFVSPYLSKDSAVIVEAVCAAAEGLGISPIEIALAWLRSREQIASSLLGARTAAQLQGILDGSAVDLPAELIAALDDVSESAIDVRG